MSDYFEEVLHEASLAYVEFPLADRQVQTGRAYARHTLPYRDGGGGEDLGRKVYQFTLTLPLFRGVEWPSEPLYPDTYNRLIAVIEDPEQRGEVEYVDPEFGPMNVKILDYSIRTSGERRDGVEMTIQLEELGFDASALDNLAREKPASRAEAAGLAAAIDQDVEFSDAAPDEKPRFSMTDAWRKFDDALNQGAGAADEVAAKVDELYFVAEKFVAFSAKDELQRWSIFISVVNLLGAAEDIASDSARNENAGTRLIEFALPAEMSAFDIASSYFGDAGRAEEVIFNNPTSNPLLYPRGATIRLNGDARPPSPRGAP